jgi:ribosomal-protein-alanine N-acetyltransferase
MIAPTDLQSERLLFSPPREDDVREILDRYAADPDVTRYVGFPRHETLDDTRAFLRFSDEQWNSAGVGPYLIRARTTGKLLGSTGVHLLSPTQAMTGYILAKDSWGLGYATETLKRMVVLARELELEQLIALCHPDHVASWKVLEKCGFTRLPTGEMYAFPNLPGSAPIEAFKYGTAL